MVPWHLAFWGEPAVPDDVVTEGRLTICDCAYLGKISCVCCNLVGNDPLLYIIPVWQSQVLLWRHIAQQCSACTANSSFKVSKF